MKQLASLNYEGIQVSHEQISVGQTVDMWVPNL